jgi:hypothetical protein
MGADGKVLLALFEAGLVESGMQNLNYGDRDSVGFLQQRPSQGWPDPTNVTTATRSFVSRAKNLEKMHPGWSAGQLAQGVQVSAFPDRYSQEEGNATQLLAKISGGNFTQTSLTDALPGSGQLTGLVDLGNALMKQQTWIRAGMILGGGIACYIGIIIMIGQSSLGKELKGAGVGAAKMFVTKGAVK